MNILYFSWTENSTPDMLYTLDELGHSVHSECHELSYYFTDDFKTSFSGIVHESAFDIVYTFNFIPPISDAAEAAGLPYVCWVYDCPHYTLYSKSLHNDCNHIFLFDKNMQQTVINNNAKHVYHMPLAIASDRLERQLGLSDDIDHFFPTKYSHEISFVGSLYENAQLTNSNIFPDMLRGYLDGIAASQKKLWGCDIVSELMTDELTEKIYPFLPFVPKAGEFLTARDVYICEMQKRITSEERIELINRLSNIASVSLFTGSNASLCPDAVPLGTVSYTDDMPSVFHDSKINLNITLRSITSGIPLRALDIMGCGGFLLTNYQPELCEYFTPDVDFVYFEDMNDMAEKARYYLSHDKEREQIAFHGHQTSVNKFSYREKVSAMLSSI